MKRAISGAAVCAALLMAGCDLQNEVEKQTGFDVGGGISDEEARSIPKSYSEQQVIDQLGEPDRDYETQGGGFSERCIYYNAKTGGEFTEWEFCFNRNGKMTTVSKY